MNDQLPPCCDNPRPVIEEFYNNNDTDLCSKRERTFVQRIMCIACGHIHSVEVIGEYPHAAGTVAMIGVDLDTIDDLPTVKPIDWQRGPYTERTSP